MFRYDDRTTVRVLGTPDAPEFVAADIALGLGYRMASDMTRRLDDDEKGTRPVRTPSGIQEMTVVTEAGFYSAVLGSKVDGSKKFKRWVTHEVLPQIRKTGSYAPELDLSDPIAAIEAVREREGRALELAKSERVRAEKAEAQRDAEQKRRRAIEGGDGIDPTTFAKKFFSDVSAREFDEHLYSHGYLIKQRNTRTNSKGEARDGYDHRKPTAKGRHYFYSHDNGTYGGRRRFQPRVRPQMEIALRDALAAEGLPVNEHSTGLILLTSDDMKALES